MSNYKESFGKSYHPEAAIIATLEALGMKDCSWHNDASPSWMSEEYEVLLYVDAKHKKDREFPETDRFSVLPLDAGGFVIVTADVAMPTAEKFVDALMMLPQVERMARAFSRVLREWLSDEELAGIASGESPHDHCDANMAMHEAFVKVLKREPRCPSDYDDGFCSEAEGDADFDVWNAAWSLAERRNYYMAN